MLGLTAVAFTAFSNLAFKGNVKKSNLMEAPVG
jgi:hypothetical protein